VAWDLTIAGASQTTPRRVRAGSLTIVDALNERDTASFEIMSENLGYAPAVGAAVVITNPAGAVEFGGEILSTDESPFESNIRLLTRVECVGYDVYADRVLVTEIIPAGQTLFQILTTLVAYLAAAPYSVILHPSQENPGPTLVGTFTWDHKPLSACLADVLAPIGYVRKIDASKRLRAWAPGAISAPWAVTDSDTHALNLSIKRTREEYVNRVVVRAGSGTLVRTQEWTSDGSQTAYVCDVPAAIGAWYAGYCRVPATGTGYYPTGIEGVEAMPFTWDPATHTLHYNFQQLGDPDLPAPPLPAGTTVAIDYTAQYPFTVSVEDPGDIATYGLREGVLEKHDVFDLAQATAIATEALSSQDAARQTLEIETRESGLASGQALSAILTLRNLSNTFLLTSVKITVDDDPGPTGDGVFRYVAEGEGGQTYRGSYLDTYRDWSLLGGGGAIVGGTTPVVQRNSPGPVWLGGSRYHAVAASAWTPVQDWQEFFLDGAQWGTARVRAWVCAAGADHAVSVRWYDMTMSTAVELDTPIVGDTWTEVIFAVSVISGHRYRLEVQGLSGSPLAGDADPCYAIGLLEPLAAGTIPIVTIEGVGSFEALTGAGSGDSEMPWLWEDDFESGDALAVSYDDVAGCHSEAGQGVGGTWGVDSTEGAAEFTRTVGTQTADDFTAVITDDRDLHAEETFGFYALELRATGAAIISLYQCGYDPGTGIEEDETAITLYYDHWDGPGFLLAGSVTGVLTSHTWQTLWLVGHWSSWKMPEDEPNPDGWLDVYVDGVRQIHATGLQICTPHGYANYGANEWDQITFGPMGHGDNVKIDNTARTP